MNKLREISHRRRQQTGATVIEYALIAGLIAVALVVAMGALGGGIETMFDEATSALTGAGSSTN